MNDEMRQGYDTHESIIEMIQFWHFQTLDSYRGIPLNSMPLRIHVAAAPAIL